MRELRQLEISYTNQVEETSGVLRLVPAKKIDPISFTQWGFCWNVFSALLVAASPDKSLLAYLALHYKAVADLLTAGRDCHFYDVSFCRAVRRSACWGWPKYDIYFAAL